MAEEKEEEVTKEGLAGTIFRKTVAADIHAW